MLSGHFVNNKEITSRSQLDAVVCDPADYFESPNAVLTSPYFSKAEKMRILQSWKQFCLQLEIADEEGMGRNEEIAANRTHVGQIMDAIEILQGDEGWH